MRTGDKKKSRTGMKQTKSTGDLLTKGLGEEPGFQGQLKYQQGEKLLSLSNTHSENA